MNKRLKTEFELNEVQKTICKSFEPLNVLFNEIFVNFEKEMLDQL